MKVIKRNGKSEKVNFNKILKRIQNLINIEGVDTAPLQIEPVEIAKKVVNGLFDGVTTRQLDTLAAETAAGMITIHPDYGKIAARIEISALHKETSDDLMSKYMHLTGHGNIREDFTEKIVKWYETLQSSIDYKRDYLIDYFGFMTLRRAYLLKDNNQAIVERPQDMYMRVAVEISSTADRAIEVYNSLSLQKYSHATPTLFNAGTRRPQLASCFLLDIHDDSIAGIYKTLSDCAAISQLAGGIGLSVNKIRAKGSAIAGTGGTSNGLVPMLRVFDATARYVDQGGGKRKGSIAVYLEPWHLDIEEFLNLKKNHGKEELRARDLFYAMWIPDVFMRRVRDDDQFTLFDPKIASDLGDTYGEDFERLYADLERRAENGGLPEGSFKQVSARYIFNKIVDSQIETGTPYMLYKDAVNNKCNQKNLGTIKSSNLCTEITEYTSPDEIAVCNLASISLPYFVVDSEVDYDGLYKTAKEVTRNLNNVIDVTYYPLPETERSNMRHRPIGIGVSGLADVFAKLKIAFDSAEAKQINSRIFETIYKGAIDESIDLARLHSPYETYKGSPASRGELQFDLWGMDRSELFHDWSSTFSRLREHGLRNSLLLAPMPTASTAQIIGNNEAFEPFTSNLYVRRTLSGEYTLVNKWLVDELIAYKLWTPELKNKIVAGNGSIQHIDEIPYDIRYRYRTAWEMSMKDIIDMAADRGRFICQSQSLNIFMPSPSRSRIASMHMYGWEKGLKTGMYYLRSKAAAQAIKFTLETPPPNDKEGEANSMFECVGCST